jgi:glycosyltransferase involved in cell wall biosynthesis
MSPAFQENQGKAHAVLAGLNRARDFGCTAVVTRDGDGQHKTREIPVVAQPVLEGNADLVNGSRFLGTTNGVPDHRRVGQKDPGPFHQDRFLPSCPGSAVGDCLTTNGMLYPGRRYTPYWTQIRKSMMTSHLVF